MESALRIQTHQLGRRIPIATFLRDRRISLLRILDVEMAIMWSGTCRVQKRESENEYSFIHFPQAKTENAPVFGHFATDIDADASHWDSCRHMANL
jgi:hypothetical protein